MTYLLYLIPIGLMALLLWAAYRMTMDIHRENRRVRATYDALMARAKVAQTKDELAAVMLAVIEDQVLPPSFVSSLRFYLEGRVDQWMAGERTP